MKKLKSMKLVYGQKGLGVKHEKCAEINELQCIVCGDSAGCSQCEFQEIVIFQMFLNFVYVRNAVKQKMLLTYQKSVKKKFSIINSNFLKKLYLLIF